MSANLSPVQKDPAADRRHHFPFELKSGHKGRLSAWDDEADVTNNRRTTITMDSDQNLRMDRDRKQKDHTKRTSRSGNGNGNPNIDFSERSFERSYDRIHTDAAGRSSPRKQRQSKKKHKGKTSKVRYSESSQEYNSTITTVDSDMASYRTYEQMDRSHSLERQKDSNNYHSSSASKQRPHNAVIHACDDKTGKCLFHPNIVLRKKAILGVLGGWVDVLRSCPECETEDLQRINSQSNPGITLDGTQTVRPRRRTLSPLEPRRRTVSPVERKRPERIPNRPRRTKDTHRETAPPPTPKWFAPRQRSRTLSPIDKSRNNLGTFGVKARRVHASSEEESSESESPAEVRRAPQRGRSERLRGSNNSNGYSKSDRKVNYDYDGGKDKQRMMDRRKQNRPRSRREKEENHDDYISSYILSGVPSGEKKSSRTRESHASDWNIAESTGRIADGLSGFIRRGKLKVKSVKSNSKVAEEDAHDCDSDGMEYERDRGHYVDVEAERGARRMTREAEDANNDSDGVGYERDRGRAAYRGEAEKGARRTTREAEDANNDSDGVGYEMDRGQFVYRGEAEKGARRKNREVPLSDTHNFPKTNFSNENDLHEEHHYERSRREKHVPKPNVSNENDLHEEYHCESPRREQHVPKPNVSNENDLHEEYDYERSRREQHIPKPNFSNENDLHEEYNYESPRWEQHVPKPNVSNENDLHDEYDHERSRREQHAPKQNVSNEDEFHEEYDYERPRREQHVTNPKFSNEDEFHEEYDYERPRREQNVQPMDSDGICIHAVDAEQTFESSRQCGDRENDVRDIHSEFDEPRAENDHVDIKRDRGNFVYDLETDKSTSRRKTVEAPLPDAYNPNLSDENELHDKYDYEWPRQEQYVPIPNSSVENESHDEYDYERSRREQYVQQMDSDGIRVHAVDVEQTYTNRQEGDGENNTVRNLPSEFDQAHSQNKAYSGLGSAVSEEDIRQLRQKNMGMKGPDGSSFPTTTSESESLYHTQNKMNETDDRGNVHAALSEELNSHPNDAAVNVWVKMPEPILTEFNFSPSLPSQIDCSDVSDDSLSSHGKDTTQESTQEQSQRNEAEQTSTSNCDDDPEPPNEPLLPFPTKVACVPLVRSIGNLTIDLTALQATRPSKSQDLKPVCASNMVEKVDSHDDESVEVDSKSDDSIKVDRSALQRSRPKREAQEENVKTFDTSNLPWTGRCGDSGMYTGLVNEQYQPHGKGTMIFDSGVVKRGHWRSGDFIRECGVFSDNEEDDDDDDDDGNFADLSSSMMDLNQTMSSKYGLDRSKSDVDESPPTPPPQPSYDLGDIGKQDDMIQDSNAINEMVPMLNVGDCAFIRRSDGKWTYAKIKSIEAKDSFRVFRFMVDSKKATKTYVEKYWISHIRPMKALEQPHSDSVPGDREGRPKQRDPAGKVSRRSSTHITTSKSPEHVEVDEPNRGISCPPTQNRLFGGRSRSRSRRRAASFSPMRSLCSISESDREDDGSDESDDESFACGVELSGMHTISQNRYSLRGIDP